MSTVLHHLFLNKASILSCESYNVRELMASLRLFAVDFFLLYSIWSCLFVFIK